MVIFFLFRAMCLLPYCFVVSLQRNAELMYEGALNLSMMLFNIESFTMEPSIKALLLLKRSELTQVENHYKLQSQQLPFAS